MMNGNTTTIKMMSRSAKSILRRLVGFSILPRASSAFVLKISTSSVNSRIFCPKVVVQAQVHTKISKEGHPVFGNIIQPPLQVRVHGLDRRNSKRYMSDTASGTTNTNSNNDNGVPSFRHIGIEEMEQILDDYEHDGRLGSKYCVIDVRTDGEVFSTGKLSPSVYTLPVQLIMQYNVFALNDEDFEDVCGFEKPKPDETLVFTCAAGIRSVYACQFASKGGYTNLVNYMGGSSEWFSKR